MGERLCPDCTALGICQFRRIAEKVASSVPQNATMDTALNAHRQITAAREKARTQNCPYVNEVNPDYPGKNLL